MSEVKGSHISEKYLMEALSDKVYL